MKPIPKTRVKPLDTDERAALFRRIKEANALRGTGGQTEVRCPKEQRESLRATPGVAVTENWGGSQHVLAVQNPDEPSEWLKSVNQPFYQKDVSLRSAADNALHAQIYAALGGEARAVFLCAPEEDQARHLPGVVMGSVSEHYADRTYRSFYRVLAAEDPQQPGRWRTAKYSCETMPAEMKRPNVADELAVVAPVAAVEAAPSVDAYALSPEEGGQPSSRSDLVNFAGTPLMISTSPMTTSDHERALDLLARLAKLLPESDFTLKGPLYGRMKLFNAVQDAGELVKEQFGKIGPTSLYRPVFAHLYGEVVVCEEIGSESQDRDARQFTFLSVNNHETPPLAPHVVVDGTAFYRYELVRHDNPHWEPGHKDYTPVIERDGAFVSENPLQDYSLPPDEPARTAGTPTL